MSARTHSGLSYAEIGKLLGMSRQNAELIGTRALNKLRSAVGSKYRGPWIPYDSEGVPELRDGYHDNEYQRTAQPRSKGRFERRMTPNREGREGG